MGCLIAGDLFREWSIKLYRIGRICGMHYAIYLTINTPVQITMIYVVSA